MSAKKYPRIVHRAHGKGKACIVCGIRTNDTSHVQISCMRGDDEVVYACRDHTTIDVISAWCEEPPAATEQEKTT